MGVLLLLGVASGVRVAAALSVSQGPPLPTAFAAVLASDVTNSTTSLADVPTLSFPVVAGQLYNFDFSVIVRSAATTTGIRLAVNGPAAPASLTFTGVVPYTAGGDANVVWSQFEDPTLATGVLAAGTDLPASMKGVVRAGAVGGTVTLRFTSSVGGSAVTIKAGSSVRWQKF